MSKVRPTNGDENVDEINLLEFFKILWDGKWVILAFTAIATSVGSGIIFFKTPTYESKLFYTVDNIPPFYKKKLKVMKDFEDYFFSSSVFEEWKKNSGSTSLVFQEFSRTEIFNGIVVSKHQDNRLAAMHGKNDELFILVKTNKINILNDFFKYTSYINKMMVDNYIERANYELKIIESIINDESISNKDMVKIVLDIKRFIVSTEKKGNVIVVQNPTTPQKVAPKNKLILIMSVVIGGILGALFILVWNAIRKFKEQLAKA